MLLEILFRLTVCHVNPTVERLYPVFCGDVILDGGNEHLLQRSEKPEYSAGNSTAAEYSFIHSFILAISIAPHQVHYYSEALPTTARILCRSFTPKRHRQLRVKDLLKVPTWRLERDSNPRPSGRKASTLPMCHHIFTPH